ncbi:MAG TPA: TonB-dependent siderophore receptor [Thermoanaerobaculia bacterium]
MRPSISLPALILYLYALPALAAVSGTVVDATGKPVAAAAVKIRAGEMERVTTTDAEGNFRFDEDFAEPAFVMVSFGRLAPVTIEADSMKPMRIRLEAMPMSEQIFVRAKHPETRISSAMKTDALLREIPQSIAIVDREVIEEQSMQGLADVVRYMPGVTIAQGEGNRDTPVIRGNASTADMFVNGVRDDVQYFRDLYNVERVEALKGPNAMIFGRGGAGGVINRVTREAGNGSPAEVDLQLGSFGNRRVSADFGRALTTIADGRLTAMYESSDSYRDGVDLERYGFNPTFAFNLGANTNVRGGYELFHDERTADRGIPSLDGRPVETDAETFFGNADASNSDATVHLLSAALDHRFGNDVTLRGRISYGDYDKFYQNVFPGSANAARSTVSISGYNNATDRQNLFGQTDLIGHAMTGGILHTWVTGLDLGRQVTDNFRQTAYFTSISPNATSVDVPIANPTTDLPLTFRQSASDADNHGVATTNAIFAQDQIEFSSRWQAVIGLRYERFHIDFLNNRNGQEIEATDNLLSPRAGVIYQPFDTMSFYASYSTSYLPRAGEQLSSLSFATQSLDPETFTNYEVGAKWDVRPALAFTTAVFRLDRGNVAVADPTDPSRTNLVDGQRMQGVEVGLEGSINARWRTLGQYTYLDGEILQSLSSSAPKGARLAHVPEHSFSLWNTFDMTDRLAIGAGVLHQTEVFASTDNRVVLPGWTRVDAGVFFDVTQNLRAQINIENLLDADYYLFAHNNNNITPGSPRAIRATWTTRF